MAFLPFDRIEEAFRALDASIPDVELKDEQRDALKRLLTWFETTYLGSRRNGTDERRRPLFSFEIW